MLQMTRFSHSAHTHTHTDIRAHTHTHMLMHTHTHTHTHRHTHMHTHTHSHTHTHAPRREPQLQVALLNYYSHSLDDAYLELGSVLERLQASQAANRSSTSVPITSSSSSSSSSGLGTMEEDDNVLLEKGALLMEKIRLELMFKEDRL